jgi:putative FmdB family regulatory protein
MPLYNYICRRHGEFDLWRSMSRSEKPAPCPTCRRRSPRVVAAPALNTLSTSVRTAHFRNEKSADSPEVVKIGEGGEAGQRGHVHHGGHPHHHHQGRKGHVGGLGPGAHSRRPWMIGH